MRPCGPSLLIYNGALFEQSSMVFLIEFVNTSATMSPILSLIMAQFPLSDPERTHVK